MSNARELAQIPSTPSGRRNLIINGAMNVAQRGTSTSGVTSSSFSACDRARVGLTSLGTWTISQETDAPDGFSNSHKVLCTTADASPAAGDLIIGYEIRLEGQDLQHLKYGTSNAQPMTLSFWVKSNKTGNASFQCMQIDNSNRNASFQYTINSANTWEYKTIVIPADVSGSFDDDNGMGFFGGFWLNSGSNFTGGSHQTTWGALDQTTRNASNLGVGGAVNDYWQITGVQLEVGSVATEFEHRSFGEELQLCKRYLQKIRLDQYNSPMIMRGTNSGGGSTIVHMLPVTMRDNFTTNYTSDVTAAYWSNIGNTSYSTETVKFYIISRSGGRGYSFGISEASFVGNNELVATANYSSSQWLYLDAEL